jgi:guanylate kinase
MIKGELFIISSPAGAGKTTLTNLLLEEDEKLKRVITYTTRKKRKNEIDGVDYVFVTKEVFELMIKENAFLEYAIVHGNYYGTPKKETFELLNQGFDVILVIDVQGMKQIKSVIPEAISIFILPPSLKELESRMRIRGESEKEIQKRLETAKREIPHWKEYDYIIINENLLESKENLSHIIKSQRFKRQRFDLSLIKDDELRSLML